MALRFAVMFASVVAAVPFAACGDDDAPLPDAGAGDAATLDASLPDAAPPDAWVRPACPTWQSAVSGGDVAENAIVEASGLVASRQHAGVLWVHNDSSDAAQVFALMPDGTHLGVYGLDGAGNGDWEDIAIDDTYLYIGDFGDNSQERPYVLIYRVAEPSVTAGQAPVSETLTGVDALELTYPDGAHNAETLLVDPTTGDLYIVTKEGTGDSLVFRAAAPQDPGQRRTLVEVHRLPFGTPPLSGLTLTTGGDVSPAGDAVLVKTYSHAFFWWRPPGEPLEAAFDGAPCDAPLASEPQGEAIGFHAESLGYYTVSEGDHQPVYWYAPAP